MSPSNLPYSLLPTANMYRGEGSTRHNLSYDVHGPGSYLREFWVADYATEDACERAAAQFKDAKNTVWLLEEGRDLD